jgi:hypothetical protein
MGRAVAAAALLFFGGIAVVLVVDGVSADAYGYGMLVSKVIKQVCGVV